MNEIDRDSGKLQPVSPETLKIFDGAAAAVEEEVSRLCLASSPPEHEMGREASIMIKNGLGFVTKMLRAMMAYSAGNIIKDELDWGKTRLPVYGVSMNMVLNNFERYQTALEKKLPEAAYDEIRPYLTNMIQRQRTLVQ